MPVHDDRLLFELLVLEGAQAGLSWETILRKREDYRIDRLMKDQAVVRNRLKLQSAVTNAKAFLAVQEEFGSFDAYVWRFVGGQPIVNRRRSLRDIPARTPVSDALSKDLLKRGFKSVGMVDDHTDDCFKRARPERRKSGSDPDLNGSSPICGI